MAGPAREATSAPLLSAAEIRRLSGAAAPGACAELLRPPQRGRPGDGAAATIGAGTDFAELRPYQAGDDPRHIDWRASARSRGTLLRTYNAELTRPLCLLIDRRAGMRFGTRVRLKVTQAVRMALWLGGCEARAGREVGAVLLDQPCRWLPARRGLAWIETLGGLAAAPCPPVEPVSVSASASPAGGPPWGRILGGLLQRLPPGGELLLLSDFAGLNADDAPMLRALGRHCSARALCVVDASERRLPAGVGLELRWGSDSRLVDVGDAGAADALADEQRDRSENRRALLRRSGIACAELPAELDELSALGPVPVSMPVSMPVPVP